MAGNMRQRDKQRVSPSSFKLKNRVLPYLYLVPALALLILLMVYPMVTVVRYSLYDNIIANPNPVFTGFRHHLRVLGDPEFQNSFFHTLYFTILSVLFHLVLGLGFAMLLNSKVNGLVRTVFRIFYILPWLFTATVVAITWRLLLNPLGVINYILRFFRLINENAEWFGNSKTALHTLVFVNIWAGYPFFMVSLLAGLQGIPQDMYEAAIIDGTSETQRFIYITIPFLAPIIMSISLLDFIWTTHIFPLVWMATGGGPGRSTEVLSTYTYKLAFNQYQYSAASAAAVLILLFSMVLAFFYVKHQRMRG
ncbi:MAG: sugar ABC transporter permease [Treponema sp.]|jgi:multiple sugar transport system permease protein|nr:sugar ABC transporter permease [Treponema sp.]